MAAATAQRSGGDDGPEAAEARGQQASAQPALHEDLPDAGEFRRHVLAVIGDYPSDGTHRYHWPKTGTWAGNIRELEYRGELFAKGDAEGRAYCCGLTFEVFLRAWQRWTKSLGRDDDAIPGVADHAALRRLRTDWFGSAAHPTCSHRAITRWRLGREVPWRDARAGDFVQLWRHSGSGHSVIFLSWIVDGDEIVGMRYWSTQQATRGVGENVERFGGERGIDVERIHVARVGMPAPARPGGGARGGRRP